MEKTVCFLSTWLNQIAIQILNFAHQEKLYSKNKGSVIWNGSACGIDLNKFDCSKFDVYRKEIREKLNINEKEFVFGFVGRITRDKGINELLSASKKMIDERTDVTVIFVGSEELDNTINYELYDWSKKCSKIIYCGLY